MNPLFEQPLFEQQFEHLPFSGEAELESERGWGGRSYRPPVMRARSMARGAIPLLRGRRPRWPLPYYGGGWPYGAVPVFAEPFPEPASEPLSDAGSLGDGYPDEGETPVTLSATLTRLPAAQRPAYQALGAIAAAIADPRSSGPGLYLIEFTSDGRRRAYSGQSDNVRTRLQQHLLCARMLGLSLTGHSVSVAPLPTLAKDRRRALEKAIHSDMFAHHRGVLTNQRRELELGLLGSGWA